jgi:hypothetical protein
VIFSFFLVLISGLLSVAEAQEASFYLSPASGNYKVGETFSVTLFINTRGVYINASQAKIFFPPERLKVANITKQNSIFSLWAQEPIFSNQKGEISFIGGLPSPGFIGNAGKVMTIYFQAKSTGEAKVSFGGEKILANDPRGTDIFSSSQGGNYLIFAPEEVPKKLFEIDTQPPYPFEITVDNEGDPTNPQPLLYFEAKDDISGISHYEIRIGEGDTFRIFEVETNPFRLPPQSPGVHPIIVRAIDRAGNYTESTTEVNVESIPSPQITVCPKTFNSGEEILYLEGRALSNIQVMIFFKRDDKLVKQWDVTSDGNGNWFLKEEILCKSGIYEISARARDFRGAISNPSESCFVKVTLLSAFSIGPWIISYKILTLTAILVLIILFAGLFYFFRKIHKMKKSIEIETEDLKRKFYKEYKELEDDILKELEILKKVRGEREITEEERKREAELLKNLADVKEVLEKELKDIEKELE